MKLYLTDEEAGTLTVLLDFEIRRSETWVNAYRDHPDRDVVERTLSHKRSIKTKLDHVRHEPMRGSQTVNTLLTSRGARNPFVKNVTPTKRSKTHV